MGQDSFEIHENLSDDSIVALVKSGDYEPVGILIKRYYPTILLYVNQLCPEEQREDAIQEATFALYSAIKGYDSQKSSFSKLSLPIGTSKQNLNDNYSVILQYCPKKVKYNNTQN